MRNQVISKNLHIIPKSVFAKGLIEFTQNDLNIADHFFLVYGNSQFNLCTETQNLIDLNDDVSILKIFKLLMKSERIILHSIFNMNIIMCGLLMPWLLRKSYWVIWGGDLYCHLKVNKTKKEQLYEIMRGRFIKNLKGFITQIEGDYELAKRWYNARGEYYYSFMYPSNMFKEFTVDGVMLEKDSTYIQVGNSADRNNNHFEILRMLEEYKSCNIKIICPLSYGGSEEYINEVVDFGKKIYGDKFVGIVDFLPFDQYVKNLIHIDVAIFNHDRQQALGNIITLLGYGKKVYIRSTITTWDFCESHNIKVYNIGDLGELLIPIPQVIKQKNIESVKKQFSKRKYLDDLEKIYNS